jgi:hypothetical protein
VYKGVLYEDGAERYCVYEYEYCSGREGELVKGNIEVSIKDT